MEKQSCILPNVQYVHLTKLVNGFQPVEVSVNPEWIVYVEPRFVTSGREEVEKGANVHLTAGFVLQVQQSAEEVLVLIYDRLGIRG